MKMKSAYFDTPSYTSPELLLGACFAAEESFKEWSDLSNKVVAEIGLSCSFLLNDYLGEDLISKEFSLMLERGAGAQIVELQLAEESISSIESLSLSQSAKNMTRTIFARLLQSEARLRGLALENLQLSKFVLQQSLLSIVLFAIAYEQLKIEHVYCSSLPLVSTLTLALPASTNISKSVLTLAAADLLIADAGAFTVSSTSNFSSNLENLFSSVASATNAKNAQDIQNYLVAVAILTTVVSEWKLPAFAGLRSVGYSTVAIDDKRASCRLLLGESEQNSFRSDIVCVLEVNLDDLSPQIIAFAVEELFTAGALDAFVMPVVMKKGRSGHLLTVLCHLADQTKMESILFAQTSTLGVRSHRRERSIAEREFVEVSVGDSNKIRIKVARDLNGQIVNAHPEYDDCAAFARLSAMPVKDVFSLALAKFNDEIKKVVLPSAQSILLLIALVTSLFFSNNSVASAQDIAGFSHDLHTARPASLTSFKGFELYSWNVGGKWHYSLLPGTNRNKSVAEISESSNALKNLNQLEAAMGKLAPGDVTWVNPADDSSVSHKNSKVVHFSMPHECVVRELKKYCLAHHLRLTVSN